VHGIGIAVSADAELAAALDARLGPFATRDAGRAPLIVEYSWTRGEQQPAIRRPDGPARPVCELPAGEVTYFGRTDRLYLEYDSRVRVLAEPARGLVQVAVHEPSAAHSWLLSHALFTLPLVELLKRRGLFSLHAAGLALDGRALVVAGCCGAGKSTLSLALARAGFGLLGDDTLLLARESNGGLRVLAFPDELDLTDSTIALFPELGHLLGQPRRPGAPKRQVRPEELPATRIVWDGAPRVLLFPRVAHTRQSRLTPIGRDEALVELAPNVLLTEPRSSQAHLDALAELVRASTCYRLETGHDLERLPAFLRPLLG
jgi:hypothetical protein